MRGFLGGASGKEPACNVGDRRDGGSIPGQEDPLENSMATHCCILAWGIPWTEKLHGLVGYCPWGHKELYTTEVTEHTQSP